MDATFEQAEFFPVTEQKLGRFARWQKVRQAINEHGPMIPRRMLHLVLDVSPQRVGQLVEDDRIAIVQVHNFEMVPIASLEAFLADERKTGRPVKDLTFRESVSRQLRARKKPL